MEKHRRDSAAISASEAADVQRILSINASSVIENPKVASKSVFDVLFSGGTRRRAVPLPLPIESPLPELTIQDFSTYIFLLREARRRANLGNADDSGDPSTSWIHTGKIASWAHDQIQLTGGSTVDAQKIEQEDAVDYSGDRFEDAFEAVPAEYFDTDYDTTKPGVFQKLLETSSTLDPDEVQDRLSDYLDIVECQLLRTIRQNSHHFFSALIELQQLQDMVAEARLWNHKIFTRVKQLKNVNAVHPLKLLNLYRRRVRKKEVYQLLQLVHEVAQIPRKAAQTVQAGDYSGALELLAHGKYLCSDRLSQVHMLKTCRANIFALENAIGEQLIEKFCRKTITIAVLALWAPNAHEEDAPDAIAATDSTSSSAPDADAARISLSSFLTAVETPLSLSNGAGTRSSAAAGVAGASSLPATPPDSPSRGSAVAINSVEESIMYQLKPLLENLVHTRKLGTALDDLQLALVVEMTELMRSETLEGLTTAESIDQVLLAEAPSSEVVGAEDDPVGDGAFSGAGASGAENLRGFGGGADGPSETLDEATIERVRALSPTAFFALFQGVSSFLFDLLQRLYLVHDLIERTLDTTRSAQRDRFARSSHLRSSLGSPPLLASSSTSAGPTSGAERGLSFEAEVQRWKASSFSLLTLAAEGAQRYSFRLLSVRRFMAPRARVKELKALADYCIDFSSKVARLIATSGRNPALDSLARTTSQPMSLTQAQDVLSSLSGTAIGGISGRDSLVSKEIFAHAKAHVAALQHRNQLSMKALLDAEQWIQALIPPQIQSIADEIIVGIPSFTSRAASSAVATTSASQKSGIQSAQGIASTTASGPDALIFPPNVEPRTLLAEDAPTQAQNFLVIQNLSYPIVNTGAMLIKMLGTYLDIVKSFPEVTPDIVANTVTLLRFFNKRSNALILGAKAVETKALRRITAKHLSLMGQTLNALLALLSPFRAFLLLHLPPTAHSLLRELAGVTTDIMSHENQIRTKFVTIIRDLLIKVCADLKNLPWGNKEVKDALSIPSKSLTLLSSNLATLHKILGTIYRADQLSDVHSRILNMLMAHLPSQYNGIISFITSSANITSQQASMHRAIHFQSSGSESEAVPQSNESSKSDFSSRLLYQQFRLDLEIFLTQLQELWNVTKSNEQEYMKALQSLQEPDSLQPAVSSTSSTSDATHGATQPEASTPLSIRQYSSSAFTSTLGAGIGSGFAGTDFLESDLSSSIQNGDYALEVLRNWWTTEYARAEQTLELEEAESAAAEHVIKTLPDVLEEVSDGGVESGFSEENAMQGAAADEQVLSNHEGADSVPSGPCAGAPESTNGIVEATLAITNESQIASTSLAEAELLEPSLTDVSPVDSPEPLDTAPESPTDKVSNMVLENTALELDSEFFSEPTLASTDMDTDNVDLDQMASLPIPESPSPQLSLVPNQEDLEVVQEGFSDTGQPLEQATQVDGVAPAQADDFETDAVPTDEEVSVGQGEDDTSTGKGTTSQIDKLMEEGNGSSKAEMMEDGRDERQATQPILEDVDSTLAVENPEESRDHEVDLMPLDAEKPTEVPDSVGSLDVSASGDVDL